jgi:hypothetical protein
MARAMPVFPEVCSRIVLSFVSSPPRLGPREHEEGGPVLDRAAGVVPLELGEDPNTRVGAKAPQRDERRVADGVPEVVGAKVLSDHRSAPPKGKHINGRL